MTMHLKTSPVKWRPFYPGGDEFKRYILTTNPVWPDIWQLIYWAIYQILCDDHSNTSTTQISVTSSFVKLPLGNHDKRTFSIMTHLQVLYSRLDNTQREQDKRQIHPRGASLFRSIYDDVYRGTEESICIIEKPVNYLSPVQIYPCWHFRISTLLAHLSHKWNLS